MTTFNNSNALSELATQLIDADYKRITAVLNPAGEADVDFLKGLTPEIECVTYESKFDRYIPIVHENVSIKKHDYRTKTHLVFWIVGEPYIYTPDATVDYIRQGSVARSLKRGSHLMIPHNCEAYDVLHLKQGTYKLEDLEEKTILELKVNRYRK